MLEPLIPLAAGLTGLAGLGGGLVLMARLYGPGGVITAVDEQTLRDSGARGRLAIAAARAAGDLPPPHRVRTLPAPGSRKTNPRLLRLMPPGSRLDQLHCAAHDRLDQHALKRTPQAALPPTTP